jgi:hypothetical protein
MKAGAWSPCPACGYSPAGIDTLAKLLILSDSTISRDKLDEFSNRRQAGEPWNFSESTLEMFRKRLQATVPLDEKGRPAPPPK